MKDIEQKRFENQVKKSLKKLNTDASEETIVLHNDTTYRMATFRADLTLDEIGIYLDEIKHVYYIYLSPKVQQRIDDKDPLVHFEREKYAIVNISSEHEYIAFSEKNKYGMTKPYCIERIRHDESYAYSTFTCQIFIPLPKDDEHEIHVDGSLNATILLCVICPEHIATIEVLN